MIKDQLSIFIPTFNRWGILSKTLDHTLRNLPEKFIVRILNNNSSHKGRSIVDKVIVDHPQIDCKIIDNPVNVGGEGNFLRCVELCETPYILVLGDDDYLRSGFIEEANFYLSQKKKWGWISFQVKRKYGGMYLEDRIFNDPFQMVRSCNNWAELMFISSSIFSVDLLKSRLWEANLWQSTLSVLPIAALKGWESKGEADLLEYEFVLSSREIVESTGHGDAHYNQVDLYQHLPTIEKVAFNTLTRKRIVKHAVRGGVKHVFKARVLAKHFYSLLWSQPYSKSIMEYKIIRQGLPYMIGLKSYFYRFYIIVLTYYTHNMS